MAKEISSIQFVRKLQECVGEYKKQLNETGDESDAAHFFNPNLKSFLKKHEQEVTILSSMNFERAFITWIKVYLLK